MITGRPIGAGGGGGRRHQFGGGRGRPLDGCGRPHGGAYPARTESGWGSVEIGSGRPHGGSGRKESKRLNVDVGTSDAFLWGFRPRRCINSWASVAIFLLFLLASFFL